MSSRPRPAARWAVPAGLAAVVVGATLVVPTIAAAEPDLPEVTAAELLANLRTEPVDGLSGTVVHRADLGLPALPGLTDGGGGGPVGSPVDATSLLDGEHTLRVWAAGPDRARVALHGGMSELAVVVDGDEVWVWRSEGATVTQVLLPEHPTTDDAGHRAKARGGLPPMTPAEYADVLLASLDPSTEVSVGAPVTVAGRPAYELVLDPRSDGTLVDQVRIAVDAADRVPTRVQVHAVGHSAPAIDVGFTDLSLTRPDDDVLTFTPPPGATTDVLDLTDGTDKPATGRDGEGSNDADDTDADDGEKADQVTVVGDGWSRVLIATLPPDALAGLAGQELTGEASELAAGLEALPRVDGPAGAGRLLQSRLFSVLLLDDGRVLIGAVDGDTLQAAAG
ncbi:LolA family protein [Cellulomonas bogoriensis]|uniref:MucB/RseB N-terminal domain-containing protein n=1 Tax=Cellulomonas bogoriensis 69B4 = DSM 16987 TaxID=1386082 RepID=A0A0A0BW62_9CELL|nr:hypothetical protein [Cellulomonas bogoriensis]KGM11399.1 hypothetical protein N869_03140 [Cellulomonas bogoriensis 69B4 = DSM 16987]